LTEHSPLFPILIILRSVRWSPEGARTAEYLFPVVERYLASVEWQVREVASQALASLLSPQGALEKAKVTATRISHKSDDLNVTHGRLLFLRRLIGDVVPWSQVDNADKSLIEQRLRNALQEWAGCKAAVIPQAILDSIKEYANQTTPVSPEVVNHAKRAAIGFLDTPSGYAPGIDLLHESAAAIALLGAKPKDVVTLLSTSMAEDAHLAALDALENPTLQVPEIFSAVVALCHSRIGNAVRTRIFDVLSSWPSSPATDKEMGELADLLTSTVRNTRYVPLREAALGALGRATVTSKIDDARIADLADRLAKASDENRVSLPSGFAR
jgi:hypothetical protein